MRDHANAIVYQVYGAMTEFKYSQAPFSYQYLRNLANSKGLTVPQIGLAWFVQLKISVIPRSSNEIHLLQNSIESLLPALPFDSEEIANIEEALENMLQGEDSERFLPEKDNEEEDEEEAEEEEEVEEFSNEGVIAYFTNRLPYTVELFWIDPETDERWPVHGGVLTTDQEFAIRTVYGGVIRAYSADDENELPPVATFHIDAQNGGEVSYDIEENGDASKIEVWFHNNLQRAIRIFWVHPESGEKYPAVGDEDHVVSPDERVAVQTFIGHIFHAYHEEESHSSNAPIKEFQIEPHHSEVVLNFEPEL